MAELALREYLWVGIGVLLIVAWAVQQLFFTIRYPSNLPRIGGEPRFSLRTRWRFHTDARGLFKEVYDNYSKKGKTVLVPGYGFHDDIILPASALRWLQRQPERLAWKDIDLTPTIRMIVAQAATRFTLGGSPTGRKLCYDKGYLKACLDISDALVISAGLSGASPKLLRPILGRLGSISAKRQIRGLEKYFEPVYRERIRMLEEGVAESDAKMPEDHLQMMLRFGLSERRDEALSLHDMTKRLCIANFGSMHQTSIQIVNMLLNIIDSDEEFDTVSVLREEVAQIVGDNKASGWTKARVAAMTRADSVARETLRLHSFTSRGVVRKVVSDGVVTEDGIALPKGSSVSFIAYWLQTDGDVFENPFKFDPFRFSRAREAEMDEQGKPGLANMSFVSTGTQNLAFSHGKHACPGRFLVDFELKMVIAYVLMNYDIEFLPEYNGKRPENRWLADAYFPPKDVKIRVRRKERAG
ncbi:hypothetical protein NUW58_g3654 [Xylaria curta]|uniref:Uncharacterized protein n=1 Tax=Xylaria curta TaxID=42375 RepID=A0ACC1PA12_9PEZI|nr:hypothetical protein NUW58_g3654 [Xylaria curta]